MATQSWQPGTAMMPSPDVASATEADVPAAFRRVRDLLEQEPFRVQFFQAVRLLERMDQARQPVGMFPTDPGEEVVRFSSVPSLAFPPSELYSIERGADGQRVMKVHFMGLCAAVSALPVPYTEFLLQRMAERVPRESTASIVTGSERRTGDFAMADFFDLFNHRLISFFYRGWQKYRFYIGYEKGAADPMSLRLEDLLGLGTEGLQPEHRVTNKAAIAYTGLLARMVRTAAGLEQILEDYFEVPVTVHQFAGTWRKLEECNQTCLSGAGGANERLGEGVIAGDEVWDHHGRIRVTLGPMRFARYLTFLPGQEGYRELCAWLRFYSNCTWESEVQLVLDRRDAPQCELGATGAATPQLGFVSWLKTRPMQVDPADATYLVQ